MYTKYNFTGGFCLYLKSKNQTQTHFVNHLSQLRLKNTRTTYNCYHTLRFFLKSYKCSVKLSSSACRARLRFTEGSQDSNPAALFLHLLKEAKICVATPQWVPLIGPTSIDFPNVISPLISNWAHFAAVECHLNADFMGRICITGRMPFELVYIIWPCRHSVCVYAHVPCLCCRAIWQ